jgi:putative NADPH-quinone reductase
VKVLVVHAHPDPESFGAAIRDSALRGLVAGGHDVVLVDLHAEDYQPCLTRQEHDAYRELGQANGEGHHDAVVQEHIDDVRTADAIVFIYPTFWSGLPAILQGWIERTMVPGVSFSVTPDGRVLGELSHVRLVVGISTYGSPRSYRWIVGDGGKRTLRILRRSAGRRCRFRWLALDTLDGRTNDERTAFLVDVEAEMASLV